MEMVNIKKFLRLSPQQLRLKHCLKDYRNDDLEEIRELGSGTYVAVYHGKWKGSDVAIKRIKASCFAGRPLRENACRLLVSLMPFYIDLFMKATAMEGVKSSLQTDYTLRVYVMPYKNPRGGVCPYACTEPKGCLCCCLLWFTESGLMMKWCVGE